MKAARHAMILDLIERYNIETQDELATRLRESGFNVTQAMVSRDIKELRLVKVIMEDIGTYKYATVAKAEAGLQDRFIRIFSQSVISVSASGNIIVLKTLSGAANAAAEAIDFLNLSEVVGTLAGDNTIFIVVKDPKNVLDLMKKFQSIMK